MLAKSLPLLLAFHQAYFVQAFGKVFAQILFMIIDVQSAKFLYQNNIRKLPPNSLTQVIGGYLYPSCWKPTHLWLQYFLLFLTYTYAIPTEECCTDHPTMQLYGRATLAGQDWDVYDTSEKEVSTQVKH